MTPSRDVERLGSRGSNQVKCGPRGTQVGSDVLPSSEVLLRAADGEAEFTRFEVSTAAPLFG
jgi:hypothetical protein